MNDPVNHLTRLLVRGLLCSTVVPATGVAGLDFHARLLPEAIGAVASPPSCLGRNDLQVQRGQVTLHGTRTFDRVCVQQGGVLDADGALTLRAGALYVDATSRIIADGQPGGLPSGFPDCRPSGAGTPAGAPGNALTILARHALVLGPISANGGRGLDSPGAQCGGSWDGGNGGPGGDITLEAIDLTLRARISARGGQGGAGADGSSWANPNGGNAGHGGAGGALTLLVTHALTRTSLLQVDGGTAGTPGKPACSGQGHCAAHSGMAGTNGASGRVSLGALTPAQRAALPPEPLPPVTVAPPGPAVYPPVAPAIFDRLMHCGTGDLIVGRGQVLHLTGTQEYAHVCIQEGAIVRAGAGLTLKAQSIVVDRTAGIAADGSIAPVQGRSGDGRYESGGACWLIQCPLHAGAPGASGAGDPDNGIAGARGGAGGGVITLIAPRILLAGTVSAAGTAGQPGQDAACSPSGCIGPFPGGGGGSGGGILVMAHEVQLTGRITVTGGPGGAGGSGEDAGAVADEGRYGESGRIIIRADILRVSKGGAAVVGPLLLERERTAGPSLP